MNYVGTPTGQPFNTQNRFGTPNPQYYTTQSYQAHQQNQQRYAPAQQQGAYAASGYYPQVQQVQTQQQLQQNQKQPIQQSPQHATQNIRPMQPVQGTYPVSSYPGTSNPPLASGFGQQQSHGFYDAQQPGIHNPTMIRGAYPQQQQQMGQYGAVGGAYPDQRIGQPRQPLSQQRQVSPMFNLTQQQTAMNPGYMMHQTQPPAQQSAQVIKSESVNSQLGSQNYPGAVEPSVHQGTSQQVHQQQQVQQQPHQRSLILSQSDTGPLCTPPPPPTQPSPSKVAQSTPTSFGAGGAPAQTPTMAGGSGVVGSHMISQNTVADEITLINSQIQTLRTQGANPQNLSQIGALEARLTQLSQQKASIVGDGSMAPKQSPQAEFAQQQRFTSQHGSVMGQGLPESHIGQPYFNTPTSNPQVPLASEQPQKSPPVIDPVNSRQRASDVINYPFNQQNSSQQQSSNQQSQHRNQTMYPGGGYVGGMGSPVAIQHKQPAQVNYSQNAASTGYHTYNQQQSDQKDIRSVPSQLSALNKTGSTVSTKSPAMNQRHASGATGAMGVMQSPTNPLSSPIAGSNTSDDTDPANRAQHRHTVDLGNVAGGHTSGDKAISVNDPFTAIRSVANSEQSSGVVPPVPLPAEVLASPPQPMVSTALLSSSAITPQGSIAEGQVGHDTVAAPSMPTQQLWKWNQPNSAVISPTTINDLSGHIGDKSSSLMSPPPPVSCATLAVTTTSISSVTSAAITPTVLTSSASTFVTSSSASNESAPTVQVNIELPSNSTSTAMITTLVKYPTSTGLGPLDVKQEERHVERKNESLNADSQTHRLGPDLLQAAMPVKHEDIPPIQEVKNMAQGSTVTVNVSAAGVQPQKDDPTQQPQPYSSDNHESKTPHQQFLQQGANNRPMQSPGSAQSQHPQQHYFPVGPGMNYSTGMPVNPNQMDQQYLRGAPPQGYPYRQQMYPQHQGNYPQQQSMHVGMQPVQRFGPPQPQHPQFVSQQQPQHGQVTAYPAGPYHMQGQQVPLGPLQQRGPVPTNNLDLVHPPEPTPPQSAMGMMQSSYVSSMVPRSSLPSSLLKPSQQSSHISSMSVSGGMHPQVPLHADQPQVTSSSLPFVAQPSLQLENTGIMQNNETVQVASSVGNAGAESLAPGTATGKSAKKPRKPRSDSAKTPRGRGSKKGAAAKDPTSVLEATTSSDNAANTTASADGGITPAVVLPSPEKVRKKPGRKPGWKKAQQALKESQEMEAKAALEVSHDAGTKAVAVDAVDSTAVTATPNVTQTPANMTLSVLFVPPQAANVEHAVVSGGKDLPPICEPPGDITSVPAEPKPSTSSDTSIVPLHILSDSEMKLLDGCLPPDGTLDPIQSVDGGAVMVPKDDVAETGESEPTIPETAGIEEELPDDTSSLDRTPQPAQPQKRKGKGGGARGGRKRKAPIYDQAAEDSIDSPATPATPEPKSVKKTKKMTFTSKKKKVPQRRKKTGYDSAGGSGESDGGEGPPVSMSRKRKAPAPVDDVDEAADIGDEVDLDDFIDVSVMISRIRFWMKKVFETENEYKQTVFDFSAAKRPKTSIQSLQKLSFCEQSLSVFFCV